MPTYYRCGAVEDDSYPEDSERYLSYDCGDCENDAFVPDPDSDDYELENEGVNPSVARDAAEYVNGLLSYETPVMKSPNVSRQVSCEFEASSGIATTDYALSLLENGAPYDHHGDVTCDGEIVFSRLRLDNEDSAHRYGRSLAVIDYLRKQDAVRVRFDSGHHIHVSARDASGRGISPNGLVSLYSVYSHCEDLLYRLAAAGWSRHRCENDDSYSRPTPKLASYAARTPRSVGNCIGNDRYQGLNVSPYLSNLQNCNCGAYRFGEWESCECRDNRATIEWRLWNGSISARKIRTYIAISAVLTDYAATVDPRDVSTLAENPFSGTSSVNERSLLRQLDYLLSRPGFTARDRDDIHWLVSFSPGMGSLARDYQKSREGASRDSEIAGAYA